ncbi:hypothetical protein [Bradyrhizobium sp. NAS80.1]|uniref:hypothetical protein n=1 Tax=Bradyrhizobium sp. NAS80.1 TaxID=1680159 RepID=UPI000A5CE9E3|nr:hypothetical protein [Bradyrhizobium sp. NAS80.1]
MFKEGSPIAYDAPAELKKWPSLKGQRQKDRGPPYLVYNGTLADCVRELMGKPIKGISLYDIMTRPQPASTRPCSRPAMPPRSRCARIFPRIEAE